MRKPLTRGRGSVDASVENQDNMDFVKWYDNKSVPLLSFDCGVEPENKAKCWSLSDEAFVEFVSGGEIL